MSFWVAGPDDTGCGGFDPAPKGPRGCCCAGASADLPCSHTSRRYGQILCPATAMMARSTNASHKLFFGDSGSVRTSLTGSRCATEACGAAGETRAAPAAPVAVALAERHHLTPGPPPKFRQVLRAAHKLPHTQDLVSGEFA